MILDDQATKGAGMAAATVETDPKSTRWSIAVEQLGETVKGRIAASDAGTDLEAAIEAKMSGTKVSGIAYDTAGRQIATFEGSLVDGRLSGTFRTTEGRTGSWAWDAIPR